jgi:hypothetical protein
MSPADRPVACTRLRKAVASDWLVVLARMTVHPLVPSGQLSAPTGVVGVVVVVVVEVVVGAVVVVDVVVGGLVVAVVVGLVNVVTPVGEVGKNVVVGSSVEVGNGGSPPVVVPVTSTELVGSVGNVGVVPMGGRPVDVEIVGMVAVPIAVVSSSFAIA